MDAENLELAIELKKELDDVDKKMKSLWEKRTDQGDLNNIMLINDVRFVSYWRDPTDIEQALVEETQKITEMARIMLLEKLKQIRKNLIIQIEEL